MTGCTRERVGLGPRMGRLPRAPVGVGVDSLCRTCSLRIMQGSESDLVEMQWESRRASMILREGREGDCDIDKVEGMPGWR